MLRQGGASITTGPSRPGTGARGRRRCRTLDFATTNFSAQEASHCENGRPQDMRKLTEIIGGSANGTIPTVISSSLIEYRVEAPGHDALGLIKRFYASIDYPRSM